MKLNTRRTLWVGLAFMSICAFWQVYDSIVPLVLKNTFDLNDDIAGVIMALDNVLALILLPLFGALSDRTNTRIGRRMPYILIGTVCACVFAIIAPVADRMRSLALFSVAIGGSLLSMAVYRSPAVALMPDVTPKPLRSKANAVINLTGTVGGILMLAAIALLVPKGEHPDYMVLYAFLVIFMLVCIALLYLKVKEPKLVALAEEESRALGVADEPEGTEEPSGGRMDRKVRRSFLFMLASIFLWFMGYNAVTTAFSKYAHVYWGLEGGAFAYTLIIAQAAAVVAYIPVGLLATRFGRKKTILCGVALLAIAFGSCVFFRTFGGIIFFFFILAGFGWAAINVNSFPMVVEMSRGADVGKYTGYYYTASQAAQIITPILSGVVLEYGYLLVDRSNPDAGYVFLFPYGALFVVLSFITMLFVRCGDSRTGVKTGLEAFDVDD
ncbi:MAG: MFS transporter [Oscillospiraceae bacterium]|nr:MFS transporter [Oscillospiraceae bacterium]